MKRLFVSACVLALCLASCKSGREQELEYQLTQEIEKNKNLAEKEVVTVNSGDIATVPFEAMVTVQNPEPIQARKGKKYSPGDKCWIEYGSTLKVIGTRGSKTLVRYAQSPKKGSPLECPDDTLVILLYSESDKFDALTKEYDRLEKEKKENLELAKELLKKSQ